MEVSGGGKVPGRDESLPLRIDSKRDMEVGWWAAYMRPLQMAGRFAATNVGGGVINAPRKNRERDITVSFGGVGAPRPTHGFLSGAVGRPVLWPPWRLAAAGRCPGGMNPSPTNQPKKGYSGESMLRM